MGLLLHISVLASLLIISVSLGKSNLLPGTGNQARINLILKSIFTPEYNVNVRPYNEADNGTTRVTVQLKNIQVLEADELKGRLTFQAVYRQIWNDPRLSYDGRLLPDGENTVRLRENQNILWLPDLYLENGLPSIYEPEKAVIYTAISPSGGVFFSRVITQTLFCPQLYDQEAKEINCQSVILSYGYSKEEMELHFNEKNPVLYDRRDTLSLDRFNYEGASTSSCEGLFLPGNYEYGCVNLILKFSRK